MRRLECGHSRRIHLSRSQVDSKELEVGSGAIIGEHGLQAVDASRGRLGKVL